LLSLSLLGAIAAKVGGANVYIGITRVTFWGLLAMAATAIIGHLFGAATG
jgi:VIT1/CCC1 family predicted Fe2+/Mn2+ transporter